MSWRSFKCWDYYDGTKDENYVLWSSGKFQHGVCKLAAVVTWCNPGHFTVLMSGKMRRFWRFLYELSPQLSDELTVWMHTWLSCTRGALLYQECFGSQWPEFVYIWLPCEWIFFGWRSILYRKQWFTVSILAIVLLSYIRSLYSRRSKVNKFFNLKISLAAN